MMNNRQETPVSIRPWTDNDLRLLERLMGEPAMTEDEGGPKTPEEIQERHALYCRMNDSDDGKMFVIVVGAEKYAVGSIGYWVGTTGEEDTWETGWGVLPEFQGRGIATQAAMAVLELARATGKLRYIHAHAPDSNAASNAVCRKVGFTLIGTVDYRNQHGDIVPYNDWRLDLFTVTVPQL